MFYFFRRSAVVLGCAVVCSLALSCSSGWSDEDERFVKTYTEILRIREQTTDTAEANPKVRTAIEQNGYTWESFRSTYAAYATEADKFRAMLDTARNRAMRPASPHTP